MKAAWLSALRTEERRELEALWLSIHTVKADLRRLRDEETTIRDRAIKRLNRGVDKVHAST
jgi:hypothetical protein